MTDYRGRSMTFGYNDQGYLVRMTDPSGLIYRYQYNAITGNLISVTYPDNRVRTYHYNEPAHTGGTSQPFALTGISDENGARFATYQYDSSGRVTRSEHAGGADGFSFTYGAEGVSSYIDPLGTARTTAHAVGLGVAKRSTTTQPCPGCGGPVTSTRTFDGNGNLANERDFNGNLKTCNAYDLARNLQASRTEGLSGSGTCAAPVATTSMIPLCKRITTGSSRFSIPPTSRDSIHISLMRSRLRHCSCSMTTPRNRSTRPSSGRSRKKRKC